MPASNSPGRDGPPSPPSSRSLRESHHHVLDQPERARVHHGAYDQRAPLLQRAGRPRRQTTETKSAFKTTEPIVFVLSVVGVLIAAAATDNGDDGQGFGARTAWLYVVLLSIASIDQPRPGQVRQPRALRRLTAGHNE